MRVRPESTLTALMVNCVILTHLVARKILSSVGQVGQTQPRAASFHALVDHLAIVQTISFVSHLHRATRKNLSSVGQILKMLLLLVASHASQAKVAFVQMVRVVLRIPFVTKMAQMQFLRQH
jgi:uncharacterized membrane protein AbrB (regulator of aidB expression)